MDRANRHHIERLRSEAPTLKTAKRVHYADILGRLIKDRLAGLPPSPTGPSAPDTAHARGEVTPVPLLPSKIGDGPRIDKSTLVIATERRLRDKAHLKFVATQPCLICGRTPSHAHHLTFCQKRGLSLKVSDEFTVPLCELHHDELHRSGGEKQWWDKRQIDPKRIAQDFWARHRLPSRIAPEPARVSAPNHPPSQCVEPGATP